MNTKLPGETNTFFLRGDNSVTPQIITNVKSKIGVMDGNNKYATEKSKK